MKKFVAVVVALSLCFMSVPIVHADIVDPYAAPTPSVAEKAFVAEVAAPLVAISYTPGLSTGNVSYLSGTPLPHVMEGSSSTTSLSLSSGRIAVKYDVRTAGSVSGTTVDFDNAATSDQETTDLTGWNGVTVGLTGNAHTVNVRFEDADGNSGGYQLTQVSSSYQRYWVMDLSLIESSVDLSRIKAIHFSVDQANTTSTYRTGTFYLRLNGLDTVAPASPQIDPATPLLSNQKTITLTGTKEAYSSVYVKGILVSLPDRSTTWTASVALSTEGSNSISLYAKSALGVATATQYVKITRDTVGPTGSIKINNGATATGSPDVTLNLTASDALSFVDTMRFSVDGGLNWTAWELCTSTKAVTLTPGYGTKTVQYQLRDQLWNTSTFSDTIVYEYWPASPVVTSPVPALTNLKTITLSGTKDANTSILVNGTTYVSLNSATSWTATVALGLEGLNTLSITSKSSAGKSSVATVLKIVRDTAVPTGSIKINNGAASTGTPDVLLNLTAADTTSGVDAVRFSVDGGANWTGWEAFAATRPITLTSGYATKEVQYQIRDKAGNIVLLKDTILYEFLPSTPVVTSPVPAATNQTTLVISGTKDAQTYLLINNVQYVADFNATVWTATVSLATEGTNTLSITSKSSTGKLSTALVLKIVRDRALPTGSIKINNGAATTDSRDVTLNLTAADTASGVDKVHFSVDGGSSWTEWENFSATRAIALLGTDGTKEVRYQVRDKAGNISATYSDTITLALPPIPVPPHASVVRVVDGDRRLFVQERLADDTLSSEVAYVSKGVNWSPASVGTTEATLHLEFIKSYKQDLAMMAAMGINTVRVYHDFGTGADAVKILDEMWRLGIKVIMTVDSPQQGASGNLSNISAVVNAYKNHPAILMWSVGDQWDTGRYNGKFTTVEQAIEFTEQAAQLIKSLDANHPVTTVIGDVHMAGLHPLTEELSHSMFVNLFTEAIVNSMIPSVDVWGVNLYRGDSFQDALAQWKQISDKPLYIAGFGADSYDHRDNAEDQAMQAAMNTQLLDEVYFDLSAERTEGALVGALLSGWNDEWWRGGSVSTHNVGTTADAGQLDGYNDAEWFGIVDINRKVKQAYAALQSKFLNWQGSVLMDATPVITVTSQNSSWGSQIKIDNKTVYSRGGQGAGGRGITVAVIDPNTGMRVSDVRTFDTWSTAYGTPSTFANTVAFMDYVNSLKDGVILSIAIADEGGFVSPDGTPWRSGCVDQFDGVACSEKAYRLLESLGSTQIRNVNYNGGWAMITVKGQGKLAEGYSLYSASTEPRVVPVTISTQLSLTVNSDIGLRDVIIPAPPVVTSPVPGLTNQTTLVLSGTKDAGTSVLVNGTVAVPLDNETTWTATVTLVVEGNNTLNITSKNALGKSSAPVSPVVKRDTVAPVGSVSINNGDTSTGSLTVNLALTGSDVTSGVDGMCFSVDAGVTWTAWEAFASSKSVTLASGYGTKTVQYKLRDKATNVAIFSDTIVYDVIPTTPVITSVVPAFTNQTTLVISGTKEAQTSILVNGVEKVPLNGSTTWSVTVNLGTEGVNTFLIKSKNASATESGSVSVSPTRDTVAPTGSFTINNGVVATASAVVSLQLSLTDVTSGVDKVKFSVDGGTTWTDWENAVPSKTLTLLPGDGTKQVRVAVQDKAGNITATPLAGTILLDTTAPTGSVSINAGAATTTSRSVSLTLTGSDAGIGVDQMHFSTDDGVTWSSWQAFATSATVTLADADGTRTVKYELRDKLGNAQVFSDTIVLDRGAPTGTMQINGGAPFTNVTGVTLTLTMSEPVSELSDMQFSTNGTTWTSWQPFSATPAYTLGTGEGTKIVYVRVRDRAGNVMATPASDTIVLDTVKPTGSVTINGGSPTTTSREVTLTLTAVDTTSGADVMSFSTDGGASWSSWDPFALTKVLTLPAGTGNKEVQYQVKDKAGNISLVYKDTINYEIGVPAGASVVTVKSGDRRLFVQERLTDGTLGTEVAFVSKGVNWSPASIGTAEANLIPEFKKWYKTDLALMAQMGVNTVRVYYDFGTGTDAIAILDEMWKLGIKVIMTVDSPAPGNQANLSNISKVITAYKNHPAILMWAVGNEWDYTNYGGRFASLTEAAAFIQQAAALVKSLDQAHPVTSILTDVHLPGYHSLSQEAFPYGTAPYTKDIVTTMVPSVDVWGVNLYRTNSFQDAMLQWKSISNKPMYIGEFGADAYDHRGAGGENQTMQADMNGQLWDEVYFDLSADRTNGALIGALAFEWNDEWWKNDKNGSTHSVSWETNYGQPDLVNDEEWFGIVDINRNVRQTYATFQSRFVNNAIVTNPTPVLSVTSQDGGSSTRVKLGDKSVFYRGGGGSGARGITVAVIDASTGIRLSDVRSFDTYITAGYGNNTFANTRAMIDYINSLPTGAIIAISVADESGLTNNASIAWGHAYNTEAIQLFKSLGSTMVQQVKFQGGWAMIVKKGDGVLKEAVSATIQTAVTATVQLSLTLNPDAGRRPVAAPAMASLAAAEEVVATAPVFSVTAQSSGTSSVVVDGKTILRRQSTQVTSRGVQVVAVDPKLGASSASVRSFSSESGGSALSSYLQSLSDGTVFTVSMTKTEGGSQSRSVDSAVESVGSKKIRKVSSLGSWAMIAVKGQGVLVEAYSDPRMPVTLQAQLKPLLNSAANKS